MLHVTFVTNSIFQHNLKKLRNSLLASGQHKNGKSRVITLHNTKVLWQHWQDAVTWDIESHPLKLKHRISKQHVVIDRSDKMRNHLAFEVLGKEMLHLMQVLRLFSLTILTVLNVLIQDCFK